METALVLLIGVMLTVAVYLLLARAVIRMLLGLALLGNAVNLLLFVSGRLTRANPPIVPAGQDMPAVPVANPLPQALILTAIVIGFSMFAFLLVLAWRAYRAMDADDTDHMRLAEPEGGPNPPPGY